MKKSKKSIPVWNVASEQSKVELELCRAKLAIIKSVYHEIGSNGDHSTIERYIALLSVL